MKRIAHLISVTLISVNVNAWSQYHLDRIGIGTNPSNEITGINNRGDLSINTSSIVGTYGGIGYLKLATGEEIALPIPGGQDYFYATALSDRRNVVGQSPNRSQFIPGYGESYDYTSNTSSSLPRFDHFNNPVYTPVSLNNYGTIVGYAEDYDTGGGGACVWNHPTLPDGYLMSGGEATDINDSGIIVGCGGGIRPTYWDASGQIHFLPMATGCTHGYVASINESGWMVGFASKSIGGFPTQYRSYLQIWNVDAQLAYSFEVGNRNITNSPASSGGDPAFINAAGEVVFSTYTGSAWLRQLWRPDSGFQDLNPLITNLEDGYTFDMIRGLNNRGQIIGDISKPGVGRFRNALLTPVPEPGTLAVLALGVAGLLKRRKS